MSPCCLLQHSNRIGLSISCLVQLTSPSSTRNNELNCASRCGYLSVSLNLVGVVLEPNFPALQNTRGLQPTLTGITSASGVFRSSVNSMEPAKTCLRLSSGLCSLVFLHETSKSLVTGLGHPLGGSCQRHTCFRLTPHPPPEVISRHGTSAKTVNRYANYAVHQISPFKLIWRPCRVLSVAIRPIQQAPGEPCLNARRPAARKSRPLGGMRNGEVSWGSRCGLGLYWKTSASFQHVSGRDNRPQSRCQAPAQQDQQREAQPGKHVPSCRKLIAKLRHQSPNFGTARR